MYDKQNFLKVLFDLKKKNLMYIICTNGMKYSFSFMNIDKSFKILVIVFKMNI